MFELSYSTVTTPIGIVRLIQILMAGCCSSSRVNFHVKQMVRCIL